MSYPSDFKYTKEHEWIKAEGSTAHGSWMAKITLKDPAELNSLLSAADYEKFIAEEGGH